MPDWLDRLTDDLEPALASADPRIALSAYHDMPYAIFRYPSEELELRPGNSWRTRLETKHAKRISHLAECLEAALNLKAIAGLARREDVRRRRSDRHSPRASKPPHATRELVAGMLLKPPTRRHLLSVRAGALFPFYRTLSLLEQLKGHVISLVCCSIRASSTAPRD